MLHEAPACQISPKEYRWGHETTDDEAPRVFSVESSWHQWENHYLVVAAAAEQPLDPILPDVKDWTANLRRNLWLATQSIRRWGFASAYWCGIVNFIANHLSFPIPEDVAQVDAIAHLYKVFIWILSIFRWQGCMRSMSISPELTDGRPTGKDYAEFVFEHITVVCWDNVPCSTVSHWRRGSGLNVFTGRVLTECLLGDQGRSCNAQRCSDQTKAKENAQMPFSFRSHLYTPQQKLGYQGRGDVAYAHKSYVTLVRTHYPNQSDREVLPALIWLVMARTSFEKHFEFGTASQLALNGMQEIPNVMHV